MCCCAKCTRMDIPSLESNNNNSNIIPTILFNVHQYIQVVLCMEYNLSKKINSVNCVILPQIQLLLKHFIVEKSLSQWSHKLWTFIKTYKFLKYRNLYFTYHTYALSGHITVATRVKRHSIIFRIYNMCCAVVIMKSVY